MKKKSLHIFIAPFVDSLRQVDTAEVTNHDYASRYLKYLQTNAPYYLHIYADVLQQILDCSEKNIKQIALLDYGAGNGVLGIFAKYCGFGEVFINEIDSSFLNASMKLSRQMGIEINGFILGDMEQVLHYTTDKRMDAIVGTDVIEHIYDLPIFLKGIQQLNPQLISCFTTAANPANYFKLKKLRRLQISDEWKGSIPDVNGLSGSLSHPSYRDLRAKILADYFADETLEHWITITRGLNRADILQAVQHFKKNGIMPVELKDAYNTCHPETGSWTERVIPLTDYNNLYKNHGFNCTIHAGYFNEIQPGVKKIFLSFLNKLLPFFGTKIAPFIFIVGTPEK